MERRRALEIVRIMIDRIKTAKTDDELTIRRYRASGAIFILYVIDIISYEELDKYQNEIFQRSAF